MKEEGRKKKEEGRSKKEEGRRLRHHFLLSDDFVKPIILNFRI